MHDMLYKMVGKEWGWLTEERGIVVGGKDHLQWLGDSIHWTPRRLCTGKYQVHRDKDEARDIEEHPYPSTPAGDCRLYPVGVESGEGKGPAENRKAKSKSPREQWLPASWPHLAPEHSQPGSTHRQKLRGLFFGKTEWPGKKRPTDNINIDNTNIDDTNDPSFKQQKIRFITRSSYITPHQVTRPQTPQKLSIGYLRNTSNIKDQNHKLKKEQNGTFEKEILYLQNRPLNRKRLFYI